MLFKFFPIGSKRILFFLDSYLSSPKLIFRKGVKYFTIFYCVEIRSVIVTKCIIHTASFSVASLNVLNVRKFTKLIFLFRYCFCYCIRELFQQRKFSLITSCLVILILFFLGLLFRSLINL